MFSDTISTFLRHQTGLPDVIDGDDIDRAAARAALQARTLEFGGIPAPGDWVLLPDNTMHRIARTSNGYAAFADVFTTEGDLEGNFHLADTGEMRYFGGHRRGVPVSTLRRTPVTAPTWAWRHHHLTREVVNIAVQMPVWECASARH